MQNWNGSIIIFKRRILFVGEAAKSVEHASHTMMIVIAAEGEFRLKVGSRGKWKRYSAAIIDAGTLHCMDGRSVDLVAIIHLLPETEEARQLRREYLSERGFYGIPAGPARKLSSRLAALKDYWRLDCRTAARFCNQIIGLFIQKPSTRLDRDIDLHVRRAINELYSRMEQHLKRGKSSKDFFTASNVANKIRVAEIGWAEAKLRRKFTESTGAAFKDYIKLLRFRATLVKLALNQAELRQALKPPKGGGKNRKSLMEISLTEAAKWMGWGKVYNLTHASKEILGISPSSLREDSRFRACPPERGQ